MDQKDEVKSKVDIVEVISSYVPLKKAGRNFSGLCPFHGEKTPSFMVSAERQAFKCFGCGESGDVFTFLEKIEGWDFREALEELAKKVGIKLKKFEPTDASRKKDKLIELNEMVVKFYSHLLNIHKAGQRARNYLKKRGIDEKVWLRYELGYAPAGWEHTLEFLKKRNFGISDIANSGLVIARTRATQGSFYDRFRDRIIFPIKDMRGTVLGFAGRIIDEDREGFVNKDETRKEAKYINSPETPIFTKGSMLFGIDVAKDAIRREGEVILVEGEFDVLSSYAAGIENVVASKGTALTDRQIALLSRFAESVVLCFDSDIAGNAASIRAIEMMDSAGLIIKVAKLGKFKDPDEFIKADPASFKSAIKNASNIYDFLIDAIVAKYDATTPAGKKKIGTEILPLLSKIGDDMMRAHYIQKIARELDLDISLIASAVDKKQKNIEVLDNPKNDAVQKEKVSQEEYFLALLVMDDTLSDWVFKTLKSDDFKGSEASAFFSFLHDIMDASKQAKKPVKITKSLKKLPEDLNEFVNKLYLLDFGVDFSDSEFRYGELNKAVLRIREKSLKSKLKDVSRKMQDAEKEGDLGSLENLSRTFGNISKKLGEIQQNLQ